jgi:hypothetical protein
MRTPTYLQHGEYLYVVMGFGVMVYRPAHKYDDMPMFQFEGQHWQCIDGWNY